MLAKKLESELKCGICCDFFKSPRILNCGHSICDECGRNKIEKVKMSAPKTSSNGSSSSSSISTFQQRKGQSAVGSIESEQDAVSESDSGIFLSHTSNTSLVSESAFTASMAQPGATLKLSNKHDSYQYQVQCPMCNSQSVLPSNSPSIEHFRFNFTLQSILSRYHSENSTGASYISNQSTRLCQLCDDSCRNPASVLCEQCEVLYCNLCREKCHPMRGPLEKHSLITVVDNDTLTSKKTPTCTQHKEEPLDYFCEECSQLVCQQCNTTNHFRHPMVPISVHAKQSKVTLSKCLQRISEKVISGTEFIQNLKSTAGPFKTEYDQFIKNIDATLDNVKEMIEDKRRHLHELAQIELERKENLIKDQMTDGAKKISQTTAMIHLAVELIKESNLIAFSMISDQMLKRANKVEKNLLQELNDLRPKCNKKIELKLDVTELISEINNLKFKSFKYPESPKFILDRCSVWDNLINVVWHPQGSTESEKYILDIDDGAGGPFKTAYCGSECICTIENLHFGANYRLRIKASNGAGVSHYGDIIRLMTSSIAKFRMMPLVGTKKNGVNLSLSGLLMESSSTNNEDTVFMATTGFCKGVHYWEYKIEYYDGVGEPSFGVAMENCAKNKRLGSDVFSWGMYMNAKRSWFQHNSEHSERTDSQLCQGTRIGVRLDLDNQRLSYFINDQPHGPIAFSQLLVASSRSYNQLINSPQMSGSRHSLTDSAGRSKMLFPAISVSHGIRISLISGLPPPVDDSASEEEGDEDNAAEMITPKKMDVSYLLEDINGSTDGSFKELIL